MKKKNKLSRSLLIAFCLSLSACYTPPDKCFDIAVLNSNMMVGFANDGMGRELRDPSVKMIGNSDKYAPMKRSEVVNDKINFLEEAFEKLNAIGETDDNKEILNSSKALFAFVLPVYKNEYVRLAGLYDQGKAQSEIDAMSKEIKDKYEQKFGELYDKLIARGKQYATKHSINVNWAM